MPLRTFKADYLLLDMNNLCLRLWWALSNFEFGVPFGFLRQLRAWSAGLYDVRRIVAFWDAPPYFRKTIYPQYKQKDKKSDMDWDAYHEQIDIVKQILKLLAIPSLQQKSFEADDLIGLITCLANRQGKSALILSEDRDLSQFLVWKNAVLVCPVSEVQFFGPRVVVNRIDMDVKDVPLFKALSGDPSDNIKGIPRIGPARAKALIDEVKPFTKHNLKASSNTWAKVVLENWNLLNQNLDLVDIVTSAETTASMFDEQGFSVEKVITKLAGAEKTKKVSRILFQQFLLKYKFSSILPAINQIVNYCCNMEGAKC